LFIFRSVAIKTYNHTHTFQHTTHTEHKQAYSYMLIVKWRIKNNMMVIIMGPIFGHFLKCCSFGKVYGVR